MASSSLDTRQQRDLRSITSDGVAFSAMVGLGEAYVPAFALAVGLGEVVAGLSATAPMLLGACLQLATPWAVRHLGSYRRCVVACACLQAASFAPLIVGAWLGGISLPWFAVATVAYWTFGMATGPAWNAWVTSLVPQEIRSRFFARRIRAAQASLFAAVVVGGLMLESGRARDDELAWFAVLFSAAVIARFVSARFLSRQSEPPGLAAGHRALAPGAVLHAIQGAGSVRVFVYLLGMQTAVNVAAPFFTPYMLGPLGLSYTEFMALTSAAFLARVAALPLIGRLAERSSTRLVLWWGAAGIVPLPVLWLVSHEFAYLICVQLAAGGAWAAVEYATLLSFFEGVGDEERASVLTAYNLANAVAIGLGALVGSQIFALHGGSAATYGWLFGVSAAGRLAILPMLRGTVPVRRPGFDLKLRTLAVRPSAGAIARPIFASVKAVLSNGIRPGSGRPAQESADDGTPPSPTTPSTGSESGPVGAP